MFLAMGRKWLITGAILGAAFLAIEVLAAAAFTHQALAESNSTNLQLSLFWWVINVFFLFAYIAWLMKYYYFYQLRRLLDKRMTTPVVEITAPDGTHYRLSSWGSSYRIIKTQPDDIDGLVYDVHQSYVEAGTDLARFSIMSNGYQRRLLKSFVKALS